MIFETLDRIGPFVVVCSQSASIPAKKRRILVRCVNCNATQEMLASSLSDKRLFEQCVCSRCRPRNGNPHTWATRAKFEELKMAMEKDLAEAQAAVRETLAQLRTVLEERDEARREADRFRHGCTVEGDFVCPNEYAVSELTAERNFLRALKKNHEEDFARVCKERDEALERLEAICERHVECWPNADYQSVVRERDEARAEVEQMQNRCAHVHGCLDQAIAERDEARAEVEHAYREGGALYEAKIAEREAFRCGAEAMRVEIMQYLVRQQDEATVMVVDTAIKGVHKLPIPEEP